MPLMFIAGMMLAQAAAQPAQAAPIVVDHKKKQVCQYVEGSGSRMRTKVCHDVDSPAAILGVEDASANAGMFHAPPPAPAPAGAVAPPR